MVESSILVILLAASSVYCDGTSICSQIESFSSYLDIATDMIKKAKQTTPNDNNCTKIAPKPVDCADILKMGHSVSGVYEIWPMNRVTKEKSLNVYCDMETDGGGWTVFQRRGDFKTPKDYFFKDWKSYKEGFGDVNKDFWLGNDNIFALTNQKLYSARFDLKDVEQNKRFAHYGECWIDDENHKYTLHISDYSGDAGDGMAYQNNEAFTTLDEDNDKSNTLNCATRYKGAWWYKECHYSNLNGLYYKGKHGNANADGISWYFWKGNDESLECTEIKIRPKNFRKTFS